MAYAQPQADSASPVKLTLRAFDLGLGFDAAGMLPMSVKTASIELLRIGTLPFSVSRVRNSLRSGNVMSWAIVADMSFSLLPLSQSV